MVRSLRAQVSCPCLLCGQLRYSRSCRNPRCDRRLNLCGEDCCSLDPHPDFWLDEGSSRFSSNATMKLQLEPTSGLVSYFFQASLDKFRDAPCSCNWLLIGFNSIRTYSQHESFLLPTEMEHCDGPAAGCFECKTHLLNLVGLRRLTGVYRWPRQTPASTFSKERMWQTCKMTFPCAPLMMTIFLFSSNPTLMHYGQAIESNINKKCGDRIV